MQNKSSKKVSFRIGKVEKEFTEERLSLYSGISSVSDYIKSCKIGNLINRWFPTMRRSATVFSTAQILLSVIFSSMSGVHRLCHIEKFTSDPLIKKLLNLRRQIDEDTIRKRLLQLGQSGAVRFHEFMLGVAGKQLSKCNLSKITIDCDSSVFTVYGHQQGAEKGYNPHKKGAASHHPLLCFCTEMKLLVNSWFRCGSAYTSNGIVEFMKQTLASLPARVKKIFFRGDSGFFNGALFDLLENLGHEYLVKVKLKNLKKIMESQRWIPLNDHRAVCEFTYRANGWATPRTLRAIRVLKEYVQVDFFGEKTYMPQYEYFCYCSNIKNKDAEFLHSLYGERAESENWIEQVKNHLYAGQTTTHDFWVNDLLWQLSVMGYNLSVMMRYEANVKVWRQEHTTFMRWFIQVPAKVVTSGRKTVIKLSKHDHNVGKWRDFEQRLRAVC